MAINLAHKSITIDVNDRNAPNVVGIVNVNDKATRYLDVTLTASGEKLTFTGCTVTATFATDGYLISDSVACTLNSTADVITVPLENFNSISGFLGIEIKIANGETQILNTPLTLKVKVTPSLAENSKINNESIGSFADISREVATARGGQSSLGARLDTADANLAKKADKTNTLAGYGIINAYTKTEMLNLLANKADKTSTLAGYGITDAYTKTESDNSLGEKADKTEVDSLLANKYDSSNIESGTSTLTPYSTVTDKIKSANCTYKTIGDIVIVSATVKMNAATIGANSTYPLIDLPYKCIAEDNVFCVGISNLGKVFKFAVLKNNTWLQFQTQDKTAYTFADGEQINVICLYKIK